MIREARDEFRSAALRQGDEDLERPAASLALARCRHDGSLELGNVGDCRILFRDARGAGRVVLLRNERDEWELPGGKLEPGEDPAECVRREIREELALDVDVEEILDCWLYDIQGRVEVVVVTYGCALRGGEVTLSHEHKEAGLFHPADAESLPMPEGYRRSIRRWARSAAAREVKP